MTGYYAKNPHYAPDDFSEERDRLERCEQEAGKWFADLTAPQLAAHRNTMAAIAPYQGSPRWDREAARAKAVWEASTAAARRIYEMALRDLMLTGEISEATSFAFDEAAVGYAMQEAV
ncbi:MAG: hypothetical protein WC807_14690 [Hyphomicrobium sp.]|jgi:hypothetical protein